jgi:hypothetical protein
VSDGRLIAYAGIDTCAGTWWPRPTARRCQAQRSGGGPSGDPDRRDALVALVIAMMIAYNMMLSRRP